MTPTPQLRKIQNLILVNSAISLINPAFAATELIKNDHNNWKTFNPKQSKGEVIPSSALIPNEGMFYPDGPPAFPHDPSKRSVVFGRGKKHHPTEIYAKAYDPVLIEGKLYVAPAAGKRLDVTLSDKTKATIWGTTYYTPLSDTSFIQNIIGMSPYDADRTFFTGRHQMSVVIYGDPNTPVLIMGRYFSFPAGGATRKVPAGGKVITLAGVLKGDPQPNLKKNPEADIDEDELIEDQTKKKKGSKENKQKSTRKGEPVSRKK